MVVSGRAAVQGRPVGRPRDLVVCGRPAGLSWTGGAAVQGRPVGRWEAALVGGGKVQGRRVGRWWEGYLVGCGSGAG